MTLITRPARSAEETHSIVFPLSEYMGWQIATHTANISTTLGGDGMLVVIRDGGLEGEQAPVGAVGCYAYDNATGFIGLFMLQESYRGSGNGRDLFARGLEFFESQKITSIGLDAVPAQQQTYARRGFKAISSVHFMMRKARKILPLSCSSPPSELQAAERSVSIHDIPSDRLASEDARIMGMQRPKLWSNTVAMKDPDTDGLAVLEDNNDEKLKGWILWRKNTRGYKIGPVFSADPRIAAYLIREAISAVSADAELYVEAWDGNPRAKSLFADAGFERLETFAVSPPQRFYKMIAVLR